MPTLPIPIAAIRVLAALPLALLACRAPADDAPSTWTPLFDGFRRPRVRELDRADYFTEDERGLVRLTDAGRAAGWRALFDGESLTGWEAGGDGEGYRVDDGVLAFLGEGGSPELRTKSDFSDFHLRLDFKVLRGANSGLFLRGARDGSNPAYSGCEVQILDDFHWEEDSGDTLAPWQFSGSLYGAVPPAKRDALRPLGEWNTYEVLYRGPRLTVALNGHVLYDVDTHALEVEPPFAARARSGFIGLQRHAPSRTLEGDAYAWFRNVFVRELRP
jgi:hypothetical protein